MVSAPPTSAKCKPPRPIIPAASTTPMKLVEQASTVETAGMVGSSPASNTSSRAMFETVGSGITSPQTMKLGRARAAIAFATGADSASASYGANGPPPLTNGVRTPGTR